MIRALNHAVLYVRDAERSAAFYGDVLGFRKNGDGCGRGMDAPLRLGRGDALNAVNAAFVLQLAVHTASFD